MGKGKLGEVLKKLAPGVLDIVGDITGVKALNKVADMIGGDTNISPKDKETIMKEIELERAYLLDTQNARDNETSRDNNENSSFLSKNIHEIIALMVVVSWIVTWVIPIDSQVRSGIDSMVTLILGYLYGRSKPQS